MKIAYFDCFSGISGDMILGALVDAGLEIERLRQELALLHLTGYELQAEKVRKQGIAATRVRVLTAESPEQRRLADIRRLIQDSALPSQVKERSVRIFTRLAEAEGKIHQSAAEEIHFHEVGALDAIVDIVGSVLGLHQLGIGKIVSSPLCTGKGFVQCAHGWLPVPAPATLELLRGCPIYAGEIDKELVTPTGAAILSTLSAGFGDMPPLRVRTVGYGAGGYELERPNVVRLILGEESERVNAREIDGRRFQGAGEIQSEEVYMIEVNLDDMNPQFYDYLFDVLRAAGASEVFVQDIQMKKNRPAHLLSVMAPAAHVTPLTECLFRETTTIGLRVYPVSKMMLPYELITVETELGPARVKIARWRDQTVNIAPEFEDCRQLAENSRLPLKQVYDIVKLAAGR